MKKMKKWQTITLLIVFLGSGAGVYRWRDSAAAAPTQTLAANTQLVAVQPGNIVNAVSASGTVSFASKTDLNFGFAGTVAEIKVKQGESVTKGQVLARIDSGTDTTSLTSLQKSVAQARVNLQNAQENLEKAEDLPYDDSDLARAQSTIDNTRLSLETALQNLSKLQTPYTDYDIAQGELSIVNAKVALKTAQDNLDKAQNPYTDEEMANAETAVATAQQQLQDAERKAALDTADAEYAVVKAQDAYTAALERRPPVSQADLDKAVRDIDRANYNLGISQRAAAKSVSDAGTRLSQAQKTLADMRAAPDALNVEQKQKQLAAAQAALAKAQDALAKTRAGADPLDVKLTEKKVTDARNSIADAEQALADLKAEVPDPLVIELRKLEVAVAQAALSDAQKQLSGTSLTAPFAGVVSAVNIKLGQNINANAVAMSVVDISKPQVDAVVSEADITRVKVGQSARLSMDGLPGASISGAVSSIAVTGRTTSGVVSYPIAIEVNQPQGAVLREGMTASVTLVVQQVTNVLVVPNRAIGGTANNPTVTLVVNGVAEQRPVTLGLSDGTRTQVLSGLTQGEMVLTVTAASGSQQRFFGGAAVPGGAAGGAGPGGVPGGGPVPAGNAR